MQPRSFTQTVQCAIAVVRHQVALLSASRPHGAGRPGHPAGRAAGGGGRDAGPGDRGGGGGIHSDGAASLDEAMARTEPEPRPAAKGGSGGGGGGRRGDGPARAQAGGGAAGVRIGEVMHGAAGLGTLVLDREMRTLRCRCAPPAAPRWQGGRGQTRPMGTAASPFVACPLSSLVLSSLVPFVPRPLS